jgi:predicted MPP superfamily phosphohydrolase
MKLIWLSDLHFEFLKGSDALAFIKSVAAEKPDAVLITGDISDVKSGPWRARSNFPAWFWPSRWVTRGH